MEVCPLVRCEWLSDVDLEALKGRFLLRLLLLSFITRGHSLLSACRKLIFDNLGLRDRFYSLAKGVVSDDDGALYLVLLLGLEDYHLAFVLWVGVRSKHILKRHLLLNQHLLHH